MVQGTMARERIIDGTAFAEGARMTRPPPLNESPRTVEGWRRGKPEEDPEKLKRWGWVSARPSEFLLRMRNGSVVSAGQGASVFKWPWDSIAIVPTTVQRLHFVADQITQEKVGVKVTGLAVYRIAEPLIASRMLNFSYPERAQEKLAEMLEEMCIGASRRLIANLTVEQCLTRRKDALAVELYREIAPVVSGSGRPEDTTDRGWGVIVDTIEIQDVRVLSPQVFANMQARFRNEQQLRAREAELAKERAIKGDETATLRLLELQKIEAATHVRRQREQAEEAARLEKLASDAKVEELRLSQHRTQQLRRIASEQELRQRQQVADAEAAQAELETGQRLEQARHDAAMQQRVHELQVLDTQAQAAEARQRLLEIEARIAALELEKQRAAAQFELDRAQRRKDIENSVSPQVIQLAVAQKLPELAAAIGQKIGEVRVTAVEGANPFGYVAAAVEGVMGLARGVGLGEGKD